MQARGAGAGAGVEISGRAGVLALTMRAGRLFPSKARRSVTSSYSTQPSALRRRGGEGRKGQRGGPHSLCAAVVRADHGKC